MTWRLARVVCMTLSLCALAESKLQAEENRLQVAALRHWAYQPVKRPEIPNVSDTTWVRNPIDQFILAKLESRGLRPAPPASPHQILRRVYLGVTGLPPNLAAQNDFLDRPSAKLLDVVINDLLRSPAYGERWGRHWLDVVRYADTNGYERDSTKPYAWRYRDYVIRAFNQDKPFDRFVIEQLAGDLVEDATISSLIATGYYLLGAWDDAPSDAQKDRYDQLDDFVNTTGQAFLGISLGCARCHDHKLDAFTQQDYYGMAAIFAPLERPVVRGREVALPAILPSGQRPPREDDAIPANLVHGADERSSPTNGDLASKEMSSANANQTHSKEHLRPEESMPARLGHPEGDNVPPFKAQDSTEPLVYVPKLVSPSEAVFVLLRGETNNPGAKAVPSVPAILLQTTQTRVDFSDDLKRDRLEMAHWITSAKNPLTARVIVNRVWQFHFGIGLVRTPDDFGMAGQSPTHPELLDWLADWLVNDAHWSLKDLHRLILSSNTYRMSQKNEQVPWESDPDNLLFSRFPRHRLDAEVIHDCMLAANRQLNRRMFGPPTYPYIDIQTLMSHRYAASGWEKFDEREASRRAVYACAKRSLPVPFFEAFDACPSSLSIPKRQATTTSSQALTLLNGELSNRQARHFADLLITECGDNSRELIDRSFQLALCRKPTPAELERLSQFLDAETSDRLKRSDHEKSISQLDARRAAVTQMCRAIYNLDEFLCSE